MIFSVQKKSKQEISHLNRADRLFSSEVKGVSDFILATVINKNSFASQRMLREADLPWPNLCQLHNHERMPPARNADASRNEALDLNKRN